MSRCYRIIPASGITTSRPTWHSSSMRKILRPHSLRSRSGLSLTGSHKSRYGILALALTCAGVYVASTTAYSKIASIMCIEQDPSTDTDCSCTDRIDKRLTEHPLALRLRNSGKFTESRPYANLPSSLKKNSLLAGTLTKSEGLKVTPLIFYNEEQLQMIFYAGKGLCGFVGQLHGGFLATVIDEAMARCAFESLPSGFGFTARLDLNYIKPALQDALYVLTVRREKAQGRKVWTTGTLQRLNEQDADETVLVSANGLFIEPRYAKVLASRQLQSRSTNNTVHTSRHAETTH